MEIQIKGTAYNIRYTIRAMFVFEQITGKIFRLENLTDYYLFYYSLLIAEAGIAPDYFLDRMQMYEVKAVLENLQHKNKTGWEQARMISYIIAQTNSTKQLSPTDIMKFDWDEAKEKDTSISKDDIARLQAKANQFINTQN